MTTYVHVGDIGTAFTSTIYDESNNLVNLSGSIAHQIIFTKPDNNSVSKDTDLIDNGISGVMRYVSESGVIDMGGIWQIQGFVNFGSSQMYTNISSFRVYENL